MRTSVRGKVVVVTGASGGVGRAACGSSRARRRRRADRARQSRARSGQEGGRVARPSRARPAARRRGRRRRRARRRSRRDELGPIDVWVNDAMVSVFARVHGHHAPRSFVASPRSPISATSTARTPRYAAMLPRDRGTIVQVGSALAYRAIPLQSAYLRRSTRSTVSAIRSAPSSCTASRACTSPRCSCRRSTRRSSSGRARSAAPPAAGAADLPARGHRRRVVSRPSTVAARSGSRGHRSRRSLTRRSLRPSATLPRDEGVREPAHRRTIAREPDRARRSLRAGCRATTARTASSTRRRGASVSRGGSEASRGGARRSRARRRGRRAPTRAFARDRSPVDRVGRAVRGMPRLWPCNPLESSSASPPSRRSLRRARTARRARP